MKDPAEPPADYCPPTILMASWEEEVAPLGICAAMRARWPGHDFIHGSVIDTERVDTQRWVPLSAQIRPTRATVVSVDPDVLVDWLEWLRAHLGAPVTAHLNAAEITTAALTDPSPPR